MIKLQAKQFKSKPNALKGWLLLTILSFSYGFTNAGGIDVHNKERIENKVALSETTATVLKAAEEAGHTIEKSAGRITIRDGEKVTIIEKKGGEISIVVEGAGKLADNLTGALKSTYDDVIRLGGSSIEDVNKGVIKLFSKNGDEVAEITNGKLLPKRYDYPVSASATPIGQPTNGYQIFKNGDELLVRRVPDRSSYSASELSELTQHPNAHVLERHGPDVTDEALIKRANDGIAPDGSYIGNSPVNPPKPPYSSKFESSQQVQKALNNTKPGTPAFNSTRAVNGRKTVFHELTDGTTYGKGVPKDGNTFQQATKVRAGYEEVTPGNWQLVTMFPDFDMKRDYKNLILATSKFAEDWWLPIEDSIGMINNAINNKMINKEELSIDFREVVEDENFDWIRFVRESQLLITPEVYTNNELKNYVKFLLYDYLFPEKLLKHQEVEELSIVAKNILLKYLSNEGWMFSYELYEELKKQEQFKDLEYYNLWKLPFEKFNIERKPIKEKDREIGYLRYKTNK